MFDESSELELLQEVGPLGVEPEVEDEAPPRRRARQQTQYRLDRTFGTTDEFNEWWNDASDDWHLDKTYTSKKTGAETVFYR